MFLHQFFSYLDNTHTWSNGVPWKVSLIYKMSGIQMNVITEGYF